MAEFTINNYKEINPDIYMTDFAHATDPLHVESELQLKIEDSLKQEDCEQDPLLLEDVDFDLQCQSAFEGVAERLIDPIAGGTAERLTDPLDFVPSNLPRIENSLKQEDDIQDTLEVEYFNLTSQCQFDIAEEPDCSASPSEGNQPVYNVLEWQNTNKCSQSITGPQQQPGPSTDNVLVGDTNNHASYYSPNLFSNTAKPTKKKSCKFCERVFVDNVSLRNHVRSVHKNANCGFNCDECVRSFTSNIFLLRHKTNIHQSNDNEALKKLAMSKSQFSCKKPKPFCNFKCDKCDRSFSTDMYLLRHKSEIHQSFEVNEELACYKNVTLHLKERDCFKCDPCQRAFSSEMLLLRHKIKIHRSTEAMEKLAIFKLFHCQIKDRKTIKPKSQTYGPSISAKSLARKCITCKVSFKLVRELHDHMMTVHNGYKCTLCVKSYKNQFCLTNHIRLIHPKTNKTKFSKGFTNVCHPCLIGSRHICRLKGSPNCVDCKKSFSSQFLYITHIFTHPKQSRVTCSLCETPFLSKYGLRSHFLSNCCPRLQCKICFKRFVHNENLMEHNAEHAGFQCNVCSKVFKNKTKLRCHKYLHSGEGTFQCNICLLSVNNKRSLKLHVPKHSCKICGMAFPKVGSPANRKHFLTHNVVNDKCVSCNICGMVMARKEILKGHMARHKQELRIKCTRCMSSFAQSSALKYHMRTRHESELEFKCLNCGMSYAKEIDLTVHKRKRHEIEPEGSTTKRTSSEFTCVFCPKTFVLKGALSCHMQQEHIAHSDEVYVCDVCGEGYTNHDDLKLHWFKHISADVPQADCCKKCDKPFSRNLDENQLNLSNKNKLFDDCLADANLVEVDDSSINMKTEMIVPGEGNTGLVSQSPVSVENVQKGDEKQLEISSVVKPSQSTKVPSEASSLITKSLNSPDSTSADTNVLPESALPSLVLDSQKDLLGNGFYTSNTSVAKLEILDTDQNISSGNITNILLVTPGSTRCKICGKSCETEVQLETHQQSHLNLKLSRKDAEVFKERLLTQAIGSFTCTECLHEFFVLAEFIQHLKAQFLTSDGKQICGGLLKSKKYTKSLTCKFCGKKFTCQTSQRAHLYTHIDDANSDFFKCNKCTSIYLSRTAFKKHLRLHASNDLESSGGSTSNSEVFKCSKCDATFRTKSERVFHLQEHTEKNKRLKQHKKSLYLVPVAIQSIELNNPGSHAGKDKLSGKKTTDSKEFKCSKCDATFETKSERLSHLKQHAVKNKRLKQDKKSLNVVPVEIQSVELNNPGSHAWKDKLSGNKTSNSKVFKCRKCDATFRTKSEQLSHLKQHRPIEAQIHTNLMDGCEFDVTFTAKPGQLTYHASHTKKVMHNAGNNSATSELLTCSKCNTTLAAGFRFGGNIRTNLKVPCMKCDQTSTVESNIDYCKKNDIVTLELPPGAPNQVGAVHAADKYNFQHCSKEFVTDWQLRNYIIRTHSSRAENAITGDGDEICGQLIQNQNKEDHMLGRFGIKAYSSDICNRRFPIHASLLSHVPVHLKSMQLKCNICKTYFKNKTQLTSHLTLDHKNLSTDIDFFKHTFSASRYECEFCGLDYAQKTTLLRHIFTHHSNAPLFTCVVCNRTFNRKRNHLAHMVLHSSSRGEFECELCKLRFPTRDRIEVHKKSHLVIRRFKCELCFKAFRDKYNRTKHMLSHSRVRDFLCALCNKSYKSKSSLKFHMNKHLINIDV